MGLPCFYPDSWTAVDLVMKIIRGYLRQKFFEGHNGFFNGCDNKFPVGQRDINGCIVQQTYFGCEGLGDP